ncbi:MAG: ABC transporter ATP-binding protein [Methanoregula sp.]
MIRIRNVTKRFGNADVLKGITLDIKKGEIFTLIGPSGSGKTSVLRILDLLEKPTSGTYLFDGTDTQAPGADELGIRRRMAMVFQKPAVLNTTVEENVAFGLKFRKTESALVAARVASALDLVGLSNLSRRRAVTLSGGEMQRVAIARAMVTDPEVLLMDEPTANLDPVSSDTIESLIQRINHDHKTTIILATHDMAQGQRLADRIGVMMDGRLVQQGTSHDIFYRPGGRQIARFVGIDSALTGTVSTNTGGHACIDVHGTRIEAITSLPPHTRVELYLRPEEVTIAIPHSSDKERKSVRNHIPGTITKLVPHGPFIRVTVDCGFLLIALVTRLSCEDLHLATGMPVIAEIKATAIHVVAAAT